MTKKIYLAFALSLIMATPAALGMSTMAPAAQLPHLNKQLNAIKRAWNEARITIKLATETAASLAPNLISISERIIASDEFISKMNATVDQQYISIVTNNAAFRDIKATNSLSDFFPSSNIHPLLGKLYTAMANKAYCELLGKKLSDKVKEIITEMNAPAPAMSTQMPAAAA